MNISIQNSSLNVTLEGLEKVWALKSKVQIPLEDITNVHLELSAKDLKPTKFDGLRFPGTYLPWVIRAGTYITTTGKEFWSVHRNQTVLVVETQNEFYQRLYVGLDSKKEAGQIQEKLQNHIKSNK